jgi:hypothetical protein
LTASFYTPFLFDRYELYEQVLPGALVVERFTQHLYLPDLLTDPHGRRLLATEARGVEIRTSLTPERIAALYEVYRANCVAAEIPLKPLRAVEQVMTAGREAGRARCYFAYHGGELIGGLVVLWGPSTVSYWLPCTRPDMRRFQSGTALAAQAMRDALAGGLRFWNWEGSPSRDSGVYRFKAKWGSVESGYRIYVRSFASPEMFRRIGADRLAGDFPNFYVYPFQLLSPAAAHASADQHVRIAGGVGHPPEDEQGGDAAEEHGGGDQQEARAGHREHVVGQADVRKGTDGHEQEPVARHLRLGPEKHDLEEHDRGQVKAQPDRRDAEGAGDGAASQDAHGTGEQLVDRRRLKSPAGARWGGPDHHQ